jgi:hypothetical protein
MLLFVGDGCPCVVSIDAIRHDSAHVGGVVGRKPLRQWVTEMMSK